MLLADLLFLRPPGLWAAIVVLGHEFLRNREQGLRDMPFFVEWGLVASLLLP
jgi:rod shape-determining protein MreD